MPEEPFISGHVGEVRAWASQFAAENRSPSWIGEHYVWPDELRKIWDQLGDTSGGIIGVVGLQGVGKSSALQAIYGCRIEQDDAYAQELGEGRREPPVHACALDFRLVPQGRDTTQ
jgi:ABC-type sugar transport system ATPase subunit